LDVVCGCEYFDEVELGGEEGVGEVGDVVYLYD